MVKIIGVKYERELENTATITASTKWHVPITDNERYGYAPFNWIMIHNASDSDIKIVLDGVRTWHLGAAGTLIIEADSGIYFSHVYIEELDGVDIAANKVRVSFKKFKVGKNS